MVEVINLLKQYFNNNIELIHFHKMQGLLNDRVGDHSRCKKINDMGSYALSMLQEAGVKFIVLKGFAVMNTIYDNYWERTYNDIDILINETDINKVENVLKHIGYIQGVFHKQEKVIEKAARRDIIYQRMYTHQIHEFLKYDEVLSEIDINFKFEWGGYGNTKTIISNEFAFNNTIPFFYDKKEFLCLNYELMFIHLCCHVYNEAVNFVFADFNKEDDLGEIKMFRLMDIIGLLNKKELNWIKIFEVIKTNGIMREIVYTMSIIDYLFPNAISDNLPIKCFIDYSIINDYYDAKGIMRKWPISLHDRLFNLELKRDAVKSMFP